MKDEELSQSKLERETSRDKYSALDVFIPCGSFTLDQNGLILEANLTGYRLLGGSRTFLVGKPLASFMDEEAAEALDFHLRQVLESESRLAHDVRFTQKDGSQIVVRLESQSFRGQDGSPSVFRTLVTDLTESTHAEEVLDASELVYRGLFQSAQDGILVLDFRTGRILDVNPYLLDMLGYTLEDFLEKHLWEISPFKDTVLNKAAFAKLQQRGYVRYDDLPIETSDGRSIDVDFVSNTYLVDGMAFIQCNIRDITDRKRSEHLVLQAARLRSAADLSSGVAHHFNNLLQIVMGNTSLSLAYLESGDLSGVKTHLEQMLTATRLGAETVRRLQTFANIRADVTEGDSATFDIATTARNAAEVSKPLWKSDPEKNGIKIDLQLDLEHGCLVKGQENEMFEVIINLIRNAAEAMPDGGDIEVKTYGEAHEVVITVRDTGTGISEEDLPRVFQPFWSNKGVAIGKGMGLAVTHGLVKRHGGTISVQSKVGKGTTLTIRLPLAREPIRKTEEPAMRPADGKLTILVIEDDEHIAPLLEIMFVEVGHSVFKALSGEEGLFIFDREHVDVVLCDLGMPGMNGWDVGKAIRSICQEKGITKPPFVSLTGWGGQDLESEKIRESGTDEVVTKPIDPAALIATVQEIASRFKIRSRVT